MIIDLNNKNVKVIFENKKLELPQDILSKIEENWKKIEQEKSNVWNGPVFCVTQVKETPNSMELYCNISDYAHYLYGERIGLPNEYSCRNLSAGCLLETNDGYFIIGELDQLTSYPRMLQMPGGNIDNKEIKGDRIDYAKTISREVKEEINIDINDESQVSSNKISAMYINEKGEQPGIQIFATAKLKMSLKQMQEHYNKYYQYLTKNKLEVEFRKIHFIEKSKCIEMLESMNNPRRNYLAPLLEMKAKQ